MNLHFSSKSDNWGTPKVFFDKINSFMNYDLDVCANSVNAKLSNYFDEKTDGLKQPWEGTCWCNPPYSKGKQIEWLRKAANECYLNDCDVTLLIPARTDTKAYHDIILPNYNVMCYIRGRLKFDKTVDTINENGEIISSRKVKADSAPFPSLLVFFIGEKDTVKLEHKTKMIENNLKTLNLGDIRVK